MSKTELEFLSDKGTIQIFCEMATGGARFSELDDALNISHTTLKKRLREAEEFDFISTDTVDRSQGHTHQYVLTDRGARLVLQLRNEGVVESYLMWKESQKRFNEKRDQLVDWAEENGMELTPSDVDGSYRKLFELTARGVFDDEEDT
jgi:DNA-binding HxlR family transcriptional regulator